MKRHEVAIRDHKFYIRRFDPFLAMDILGDLQKQFLGPVLSIMGEKKPGEATDTAAFIAGLKDLSAKTDGRTLRDIAQRLLNPEFVSVSIDRGDARKFDDIAAVQCELTASEVLQLCMETVKWNYADFIERWGGLISSGGSLPLVSQSGSSALN